ncbi:hypothetical protein [Micromonospora coerulea]
MAFLILCSSEVQERLIDQGGRRRGPLAPPNLGRAEGPPPRL